MESVNTAPVSAADRLVVMQLLPALDQGGVERGTLELAKALVTEGHRSLVVSGGGEQVAQLEREGSTHVVLPIGAKRLATLRTVGKLRVLIERERPHILHLRSRLPAWVARLALRGVDSPPLVVTTVHGAYSVSRYSAVMTRGDRVIAVSEFIRDYIQENYPAVDPSKIEVIHRGVSSEVFSHGFEPDSAWLQQWRSEFPHLTGRPTILLPARITQLKGHMDYLQMVALLKEEYPDLAALVVGGVANSRRRYMKELRSLVTGYGLEQHCYFLGSRHDLREIMAVTNVVLSLSKRPEAFGRTVLEALRLGVPVVAYNHGGVSEIMTRIYPQGLIPLHNWKAAAQAVADQLEQAVPPPECQEFELRGTLSKTISLYRELRTDSR